ncbi:tRNA (adenosine(37)-N6)-threonylcarbamoyltransferase complex ATPase subunit type 1 TsaE [Candidatus Nanogingivalis gingivitcus]|uniref:tRNA threonylcarbamoyladenosine biosynthesis protein TsaE n=1 Tax=Candidatus Nanogingivalis gingivitcus TaxID=2171992 RepID=A0ABY0FJ37_9BACT|nr:tRNA (adenosine(37)-N6)-threonylcarbamoyltransferase complex ATPase subunit type 1 TsaE [Candidatus Nanogingivalis gingivitcus]RYC72953.1 tRNA threonylcarbamoyladenosine biosynthesis protein TsaE [Candidatus Nanogingivalis gingivitcus]
MNVNIKTISSSEDMISFGQELGNSLKGGEVIELIGDVGAGKTTFTKGLAKSLGITDEIQSPTFTISRVYEGAKNNLVHYDFYRLNDAGIMAIEMQDVIDDPNNITVIEWGEPVREVLPKKYITVKIKIISENIREVEWSC